MREVTFPTVVEKFEEMLQIANRAVAYLLSALGTCMGDSFAEARNESPRLIATPDSHTHRNAVTVVEKFEEMLQIACG